jgi:hypothetical protein
MSKDEQIRILREALIDIENWKLPVTGQFWDKECTRPISYSACYGSSGEREYMRKVATKALTQTTI